MSVNNGMDLSSGNRTMSYLKRGCKNREITNSLVAPKQSKTQISSAPEEEKPFQLSILLTNLPNEILVKILGKVTFDDLFKLECVNKQLREVILNLVWPKKHRLSFEAINQLHEKSYFTKNKYRSHFFPKTPRITNKQIKLIFSRANIYYVDLSAYQKNIWDEKERISSLFFLTPQLLTIDLSFVYLNRIDLFNIAKYCPLLEEISLENSLDDTSDSLTELEEGLKEIFLKCPNIKYLNTSSNEALEGSTCFAHIPTQLRYLNIVQCFQITSDAMNLLSSKVKNLETLVLDYNEEFQDFNEWLYKFEKLKYLDISRVNEKFLDFSNLKNLEMIHLGSEHDLINIETLKTLSSCRKLKALDIKFSQRTQINILEILKNCSSLKYCHFQDCNNLDSAVELVQKCQIKYLAITDCMDMRADIIKSLLTECNSLTHLEFTFNWNFDYKAIQEALKEKNPQRRNILKLVIQEPPFEIPLCKWCEIIPIEKHGWRLLSHFTDVSDQYHCQKASLL